MRQNRFEFLSQPEAEDTLRFHTDRYVKIRCLLFTL
jgi:hypothetical protein